MTEASGPAAERSQQADDKGEKPTAYEALLRRAQNKVKEDKPVLDALLGSSSRSSHTV